MFYSCTKIEKAFFFASVASFCHPVSMSNGLNPCAWLIVDPQGLPTPLPAYVQLEATQLSHSPLIYEVLLSGCLHNPVQQTRNTQGGHWIEGARRYHILHCNDNVKFSMC